MLTNDRGDDAEATLSVDGFPLVSHWHFVYPVGKQLSFAAQSFLDLARAQAKNLEGTRRPDVREGQPPSPETNSSNLPPGPVASSAREQVKRSVKG